MVRSFLLTLCTEFLFWSGSILLKPTYPINHAVTLFKTCFLFTLLCKVCVYCVLMIKCKVSKLFGPCTVEMEIRLICFNSIFVLGMFALLLCRTFFYLLSTYQKGTRLTELVRTHVTTGFTGTCVRTHSWRL